MDLITLAPWAPWAPWVLFGAALAVIFLRLRRPRRSGARRGRRPEVDRDQHDASPSRERATPPRQEGAPLSGEPSDRPGAR